MAILTSYSVLGEATALQAAGADITVNDHMLSITSCPSMDFRKIIGTNGGWLAPVTAVPASYTLTPATPSTTVNSVYTFLIQQYIVGQGMVSQVVSYTAMLSGETPTTIVTALNRAITANSQLKVTTTTGATLVITGTATNPYISITNLSPISSNLTVVNGTAYVAPRGQYTNLINSGVAASAIATGHTYYQVQFVFVDNSAGDWMQNQTVRVHTLYVYGSATNFAAFSTAMANTLNGVASTGTMANAETVSINS